MNKFFLIFLTCAFFSLHMRAESMDSLALTPPMGWNSWNCFSCNINEAQIREIADLMVSTGMRDAGYVYLNIDDCWQVARAEDGTILVDKKNFPSGIKALADYIHSKGLKFGVYSCAGSLTCAGRPGSRGYQFQDARTYAEWGVDYLKYDWCFDEGQSPQAAYKTMRDALNATGRPIVFSICEWGNSQPWKWAKGIGHLWRTTGDIINAFKGVNYWGGCGVVEIIDKNDYEGCKDDFLKVLAMECPFTYEEFTNESHDVLAEKAFQMAMADFKRKTDRIQAVGWPVIKEVFENQGDRYERIMVPITDGKRIYNIPCNLKDAYDTECKTVVKQFEKTILLHIIDDCWKENLRALDELKHSVQNASYEQKDPLVIFKLESVKLFDDMVNQMNNRIVSILMRAQIPEIQREEVREAAPEQRSQQYTEQKDELTDPGQKAAASQDTRQNAEARRQPIRKDKLPGRNDPCPCGSGKKFKNCHGRGLV